MEYALYEIGSISQFVRLPQDNAAPDYTAIMNFRHLLEKHKFTRRLLQTGNLWLSGCGVMTTKGTTFDAKIVSYND